MYLRVSQKNLVVVLAVVVVTPLDRQDSNVECLVGWLVACCVSSGTGRGRLLLRMPATQPNHCCGRPTGEGSIGTRSP